MGKVKHLLAIVEALSLFANLEVVLMYCVDMFINMSSFAVNCS